MHKKRGIYANAAVVIKCLLTLDYCIFSHVDCLAHCWQVLELTTIYAATISGAA